MTAAPLLLQVWKHPARMAGFSLRQWDLLLRQSDSAELTASLLYLAIDNGLLERLPEPVQTRLERFRLHAQRHRQAVDYEVRRLLGELRDVEARLLLLKGAAYTVADLPPSRGRLFSDIDILVPKALLNQAEAALLMAGWISGHHDEYDQRYYREWMHELPPMQHVKRQAVVDVHHAILPASAAARPDPDKLRAMARPVAGKPGLYVLAPVDMVLHSAVHLFYEGEFNHGLRDLVDLHRLLGHWSSEPGFWNALPERARELEASRPLFYALRYTSNLLGTEVPPAVILAADAGRPAAPLLALMDALFGRALLPPHPSCADRGTAAARFLLYIRGNWLRMPPLLLARHLFHKAFLSPKPVADT